MERGSGWELKNTANGHEAEFIQKIVEELSLELRSVSFNVDEKLVGMETWVKEVVSALGTDFDVACIMKGWWKDDAIKALESCGFHARNGLRVLQQKSLITINGNSNYEWVDMHDHILEMGRNIVRRLHTNIADCGLTKKLKTYWLMNW
uniref:Disease resistance protein Roq1-like winged-helix domain-containing protein n=2 Tax=Lactuca sativa TaxID=4236 RepID=A0A9R1VRX9_LACSA|nr:hypothetical protein LSAT_V11C400213240 [Lactuca sativa]